MRSYRGLAPALALACALAMSGTSAAQAQDTSQVRSDTAAYQDYGPGDTSAAAQPAARADSGAAGYTGPSTDTTLKAAPGVQTGPAAGDTSQPAKRAATAADSVICKDGSNSARTEGCVRNGGIDWVSTEAAMKARGEHIPGSDTSSGAPADSGKTAKDTTRSR